MLTRYKVGGYGAVLPVEDGQYVAFDDLEVLPGKRSDIYCCAGCEQLYLESKDHPELAEGLLYCEECVNAE